MAKTLTLSNTTMQSIQLNRVRETDGTISGFDFATPTHTSSHYKAFETPYLYEILGGDRNMEQTHLVVTPDKINCP